VKHSAGVLMYRRARGVLEVLLAHPGGPFWRTRDDGAWTVPKGALDAGESPEAAARREFEEEIGVAMTSELQPLPRVRQRGGKWVEAFAAEGDFDVATLRSNTFETEWPPRSGRTMTFPEVDRAEWFDLETARRKILPGQAALLDHLETLLQATET
jgi:predicted NUDIX family NTP pyrophosphohydrolase